MPRASLFIAFTWQHCIASCKQQRRGTLESAHVSHCVYLSEGHLLHCLLLLLLVLLMLLQDSQLWVRVPAVQLQRLQHKQCDGAPQQQHQRRLRHPRVSCTGLASYRFYHHTGGHGLWAGPKL